MTETIMLVEDQAFVRGVTRAVLESAGYSVVAVGNATEAQRAYEQRCGRMDLLVTDIVLPDEDGRRLARRLAKMNSAMQVLLVTGYMEEMEIRESQEDGESLLPKPFAAATLLQRVRQLLAAGAVKRGGESCSCPPGLTFGKSSAPGHELDPCRNPVQR